jgi:hypothetical protein
MYVVYRSIKLPEIVLLLFSKILSNTAVNFPVLLTVTVTFCIAPPTDLYAGNGACLNPAYTTKQDESESEPLLASITLYTLFIVGFFLNNMVAEPESVAVAPAHPKALFMVTYCVYP